MNYFRALVESCGSQVCQTLKYRRLSHAAHLYGKLEKLHLAVNAMIA